MSTSTRSTFFAASLVALLAASGLTGCAETVTASSRHEPGTGALASLGGGREANTPPPAESRAVERPAPASEARADRETRSFSRYFDCRMCR